MGSAFAILEFWRFIKKVNEPDCSTEMVSDRCEQRYVTPDEVEVHRPFFFFLGGSCLVVFWC